MTWKCEGSLTSLAKPVFRANVLVKGFNTELAILDVGFLLLSVAEIFYGSLSLLGGVFAHDDIVVAVGEHGAVLDAVCRRGQGGDGRRRTVHARERLRSAGRQLRGTLRGLRVE